MVLYWQQWCRLCLIKWLDNLVGWLYTINMEHPLISNVDELTTEQLQEKISELTKKLGIAMRTGNGHLCNQLRMALETFNNKYQERLRGSGTSFDEVIDIS